MKSILIISLLILFSTYCFGQGSMIYHKMEYYVESSQAIIFTENYMQNEIEKENVIFSELIEVKDAAAIRLIFDDYNLGENSKIKIESVADKGTQVFTGEYLDIWRGKSAIFYDSAVKISLVKYYNDSNISFSIKEILVGEIHSIGGKKSECEEPDERIPSEDGRVARMPFFDGEQGNCTAFLIYNGAIVTAGHCIDYDDDGYIDSGADLIEFTAIYEGFEESDPDDQYPIDQVESHSEWRTPFYYGDLDEDWAVIRCLPNSLGRLPHQGQNDFFRVTNDNPGTSSEVEITGYGADASPYNAIQQKMDGPYFGEEEIDDVIYHNYDVFAAGGNSGSPIIWEGTEYTMGVHTIEVCDDDLHRVGVSYNTPDFGSALQNFHGSNTTYVDLETISLTEDGTIFSPFEDIEDALDDYPEFLYIAPGTYSGYSGLFIDQEIEIVPPACGVVVINP